MASRFWRMVLGLQLTIAAGIAAAVRWPPRAAGIVGAVVVACAAFAALQYLAVAVIAGASRLLAPHAAGRTRWRDALRMALTEPVYFCAAECAMATGARLPPALAPAAGRRGPLLLVHGFACNPAIWRSLLPRLRAAGFEPVRGLELEPFRTGIDANAARIAAEVIDLQRTHGPAPVTLLAHSMGGLACRAALRELDARQVRRLVTVATPHHGAAAARLCRSLPVRQMRPGSAWLEALNAAQENRLPVPVTSIFSLDDDLVMPAASGELGGARQRALRGLGHFGLLAARRAHAAVLQALREAP